MMIIYLLIIFLSLIAAGLILLKYKDSFKVRPFQWKKLLTWKFILAFLIIFPITPFLMLLSALFGWVSLHTSQKPAPAPIEITYPDANSPNPQK
jgi:hypothetical protein